MKLSIFQREVAKWLVACFGAEVAHDLTERHHRFLEEALELCQSSGCSAEEAHQLVDYVFGRPKGAIEQEVGGTLLTLAALCEVNNLSMEGCGDAEMYRVWTKIDQIREKQGRKPKFSPLPGSEGHS